MGGAYGEGLQGAGLVVGTYLMKASPDRDLYVQWSTVTDNWTLFGTRAEFVAHLSLENARRYPPVTITPTEEPEALLARCDATGTSVRFRYPSGVLSGGWGVPVMIGQRGTIDRDRLGEYLDAVLAGDYAAITAMIRPFED